ncbi:unnamed protein product [Merluccius merluccius]
MHKRGRPRKNPLPPAGDLMRPKVWKPLGRPRKYPRLDPTESPTLAPRRARGRPRKVEIKRGFNLRKVAAQPSVPNDGRPRSRGRPSGTVKDSPPRKRGRPKGSVNESKAANQTRVVDGVPAAAHHQRERRKKQVDHEAGQAETEWEEEAEEEGAEEEGAEEEGAEEEEAGETDNGITPLEGDATESPAE